MWGTDLPLLGVILCFINQHATLVALGGIWSLWDAERAAGLPLLETCGRCYGGDEGLDFLLAGFIKSRKGYTQSPCGWDYDVDGERGREEMLSNTKSPCQSWQSMAVCVAGSRAELAAAVGWAESTCCSVGKEGVKKKKKRLIRTLKTLYVRISVVRVVQASRRCDWTAHYLFRMMRV